MHVATAGMPGSGDLLAEKWQYRQFIFNVCTCRGCGNRTGCTGLKPCDVEAPLNAESIVATAAIAMNPDTVSHFLRNAIRES
jgi:hypothetical protein